MKNTVPQIINSRLQAGVWHAELIGAGAAAPAITAFLGDKALPDLSVTHDATRDVWQISVPLPREVLSDGTQTCMLKDGEGKMLAGMTIIAGADAAENLAAEVALIRAELDLLKAAFRDSQRGK